MWIRFSREEVLGCAHYLGVLIAGLGAALLVPLVTALVFAEWDPALDYAVGVGLAALVGVTLMRASAQTNEINHRQAIVISALGWLAASFVGAVPLALSGHYGSYLDALFETVSGLTTSGLTLTQDLDHMAHAHNMWRHMTHLIGGQGIIVAAVSLAIGLKGGAFSLYLAEGRDERILPNVVHTARFIWFVTAVWIAVCTSATFIVNLVAGMEPVRGLLHAFWLTIACYDTGGFGPQSQNAMYYHSGLLELSTAFAMLVGTINFNLHADIWRGDRTELFRNIEVRTLVGNVFLLIGFASTGLAVTRLYNEPWEIVRKGAYHVLSANSGTGHQAIYSSQWDEVGAAAFFSVVLAMAFGGMVSSTAGGIKALRVGIILKGIVLEVRRSLSPQHAVIASKFHHIKDRRLTSDLVGSALMVFALYMVTYLSGALVGAMYGYPLHLSLFESVSAAANVGLSTGITSPTMPTGLKVFYMVQMWAGRLEFFTLLTLIAAILVTLMPRKRTR